MPVDRALAGFALLACLVCGIAGAPAGAAEARDRARVVAAHDLPPLDGRHLRVTLVEVTYGPGEASPPHTHPCAVLGYVLAGAIRTQVDDQPEAVYHAGETFFERPHAAHRVSANASAGEEARFLAAFTCDGDAPLSAPLAHTRP